MNTPSTAHIQEKVLETLGFYQITEILAEYYMATDSHALFLEKYPVFQVQVLSDLHENMKQFSLCASKGSLPHCSRFGSLSVFLSLITKRKLYIEEAMLLRRALDSMHLCYRWAIQVDYGFYSRQHFPQGLYDTFSYYFDSKGELRSDHIPVLQSIEKARASLQRKRVKIAQEYIQTHKDICQSEQATMRDKKLLVPIKSSFRSQVQGAVHSTSASSETVFMELHNLQELNNEMEYLGYKEQKILYDICCSLSDLLRRNLDSFQQFYEQFLYFDIMQAQYHYGKSIKGHLPTLVIDKKSTVFSSGQMHTQNKDHTVTAKEHNDIHEQQDYDTWIQLLEAKHPLHDKSEPIDIRLEKGCKQLIITGANGCGKTYALKVLGLLVLMNQCAIPIPVSHSSSLPVFRSIAMVIGDTQNIEKGMSTFSAHLQDLQNAMQKVCAGESESIPLMNISTKKSIGTIQSSLEQVTVVKDTVSQDENSLLLIDEICSDTDDREGGTLAWAILEYLAQYPAYVVLTTHLALLKQYALSNSKVEIASVELAQTVKGSTHYIRYGHIGSSEAVACAQHIGMPSSIIKRQQIILEEHGKEYQEYLKKLQQLINHWEQKQHELLQQKKQLQRRQHEVSQKEKLLQEKEEQSLKEGYMQGTRLLQQLRKSIEQSQLLQKTLETKQETLNKTHTLNNEENVQELQCLRTFAKDAEQELSTIHSSITQKQQNMNCMDFAKGDIVILKENNAKGTVLEILKHDYYVINVGIIKMRVHARSLQPSTEEETSLVVKHHSNVIIDRSNIEHVFHMQLDLRGQRVDEALRLVDKNIDMALLQRAKSFSVIHGKGEGTLLRAIHRYVEAHSAVQHKEFVRPDEGGYGITKIYVE